MLQTKSWLDGTDEKTIQRYHDYREEGYSAIQARLMSGLSDPEMEGMYIEGEDD